MVKTGLVRCRCRADGQPGDGAAVKRERIREQLLAMIDDYGPGQALPAERYLASRFAVSRPTVRAAIDDLVAAGVLVRQHGRGNFTSPRKVTQVLSPASTTDFNAPAADGDWSSRVVSFEVEPAGAWLSHRLMVSPSEDVLTVTRVRVVEALPMALERIQVPHALVPDLAPADMETGSFYQLLRKQYGITVTDAVQVIEPTVTDAEEAEILGVPRYAPALSFQRTTSDATGRVVEFTRSIYRGDRYRITSHLHFDEDAG